MPPVPPCCKSFPQPCLCLVTEIQLETVKQHLAADGYCQTHDPPIELSLTRGSGPGRAARSARPCRRVAPPPRREHVPSADAPTNRAPARACRLVRDRPCPRPSP